MKYLNKITVATMGIETREAEKIGVDANGKEVPILRVYGKVSGAVAKEGDLGPYITFNGQFEAQNLVTGEKGRSDKMIVPSLAETCFNEVYMKGLEEAKAAAGADAPKDGQVFVAVAADITTMKNPSHKGGWKHKYGVAPLIEATGEDDLTRLAASFPAPKLLSGPAKGGKK
jgi:hypothetical protein